MLLLGGALLPLHARLPPGGLGGSSEPASSWLPSFDWRLLAQTCWSARSFTASGACGWLSAHPSRRRPSVARAPTVACTTSWSVPWRPPRYDHVGTHRNRSFLDYVKVAFRLYQAGGPPAGPGTAEPLLRADDVANAKFAQVPGPELCATALGGRAFPGASLNPSSADSSGGFRHAFFSEAL